MTSSSEHNYCDNDRLMALVEASTVLDPVCSLFGGDASILSVSLQDDEAQLPPRKRRRVTVTLELSVTSQLEEEEERQLRTSSSSKIPAHAKPLKKRKSCTDASPTTIPPQNSSKQQEEDSVRCCSHCKDSTPSQWRHHPQSGKDLCNACWVHFRSYGSLDKYLPKKMATRFSSKKKRKANELDATLGHN